MGVAYPTISLALVSVRQHDQSATPAVQKVFRHELAHVMLGLATNHAPVPRWFAEGLAIEQAAERTLDRIERLAMASFTGGLIPWRTLDESFSQGHGEVDVAYAQSADMVNWLIRSQGPGRLPVLTMHLREGVPFEQAARETWGRALAGMESSWRDDARMRFTLAPLWGGGFLGLAGATLTLAAVLRRRGRAKKTLARWEREDRRRARFMIWCRGSRPAAAPPPRCPAAPRVRRRALVSPTPPACPSSVPPPPPPPCHSGRPPPPPPPPVPPPPPPPPVSARGEHPL